MKLKYSNIAVGLILGTVAVHAEEIPFDYSDLNIESLMKVSVTTVSKREELLSRAAAAVYVVTQKDIQRAGYHSLAEALRLVPGVNVAKVNANSYSISIRGFNERFANKLLVLVDGKPQYTPFFSGMLWDMQSIPVDSIERIEVIRGPGATLWGANAVNGVINVITRHAKDTTGNYADLWANDESYKGMLRHGGSLGKEAAYRLFVQKLDEAPASDVMDDSWQQLRTGFRFDWENAGDAVMLRGHWLTSDVNEAGVFADENAPELLYTRMLDTRVDVEGGELVSHWQHNFNEKQNIQLQLFYDKTSREAYGTNIDFHNLSYRVETLDLDVQYNLDVANHQLTFGLNYREYDETLNGSFRYQVEQSHKVDQWKGVFAQDQISFLDDEWVLTLGAKYEEYDQTSGKMQPNLRLAWAASDRSTFWGSAARAVRTAARVNEDVDFRLPTGVALPIDPANPETSPTLPLFLMAKHSNNIDVETMDAFELGMRSALADGLSLDVALFYNQYEDVIVVPLDPSSLTPEALIPALSFSDQTIPHFDAIFEYGNHLEGHSTGGELTLRWQALDNLNMTFWYSYLDVDLKPNSPETVDTSALIEQGSPRHQASLAWQWSPVEQLNVDGQWRYVDKIGSGEEIDGYHQLDLHTHWQFNQALGLGLSGQNLLHSKHAESPNVLTNLDTIEFQRQFLMNLTYRF